MDPRDAASAASTRGTVTSDDARHSATRRGIGRDRDPAHWERMMRSTEVLLTLACVFMIGCGQILFKLAARDVTLDGINLRSLLSWLSPAMLAALCIYAVATLLWVWVLRTASLSVVYPLYALAFVLVPLLGWMLFGEPMTARHWFGAALIVGGVWLMTGGAA